MRTVGRWIAGVLGVLLLVCGAGAAWATAEQRGSGGWFTSEAHGFRTTTRALVADEVDVTGGRPGDPVLDVGELGNVRVHATRTDRRDVPLFLGIGRRDAVDRYLRGVANERLDRVRLDPFRTESTRVAGTRTPAPPARAGVWVATGSDTRDLTWNKTSGAWSLVAMNADGSRAVAVRADVGLRFAFLPWLALGLLVVGVLVLLLLALTGGRARAERRARREPPAAYGP
ncbi:hypothetical protein [Streptomyces sp. ODS28]|uniref:hypothetical protein n=1 Tax=Streptomyces sp. ODS28 TaxID=3136688 RepID=UPI0031F12506